MELITELLEPSFFDVATAIAQAAELPELKRRHWICSVRQIARWLDRPAALIPARVGAVEARLRQIHHARVGTTLKTLANHKANGRAALRWFAKQHNIPQHGMVLSSDWVAFRSEIGESARNRLSNFIRYCSARGIEPNRVCDAVFDEYWHYRTEITGLASDDSARRHIARKWNACMAAGYKAALQRLSEPPVQPRAGPAWDDFPDGLRKDVDAYFAGLTEPHRGFRGRRNRPCQPSTIRSRRAELVAVARMAVRVGVPKDSLISLSALLHPEVVERVIDAYWQKNGSEPKVFTINLGWRLLKIARETSGLDPAAIDRLDEIRAALEHYRRSGLTAKNLQLVRQVLTDGVWREVISLPLVLMQQARSVKHDAPTKAAVTAQLAIAIAILTFAPIRVSNLASIELGKNLIRPGGPDTPYWLVFPYYDVKNRVDLNYPFDQPLTELIDEYVHAFRPALLRVANTEWLFPGEGGQPKTAHTLGEQMMKRVYKAVGLRITPHQFRHAAAAIYLKHRPGDYENVRRFLGHRNVQTTINCYCGLQTTQATEQFGNIIRQQIRTREELHDDRIRRDPPSKG